MWGWGIESSFDHHIAMFYNQLVFAGTRRPERENYDNYRKGNDRFSSTFVVFIVLSDDSDCKSILEFTSIL